MGTSYFFSVLKWSKNILQHYVMIQIALYVLNLTHMDFCDIPIIKPCSRKKITQKHQRLVLAPLHHTFFYDQTAS